MKKPYQIESQRAVKQLEAMAADGNPAVQMVLPMAEMVGWLRKGVGELIRQAGLQLMDLLMQEEVRELVGERSQRQAERTANRWGSERGYCVVMGQKVPIERPRVRTTDDQEVRLGSYEMFHRGEPLTETVWEKLMLGLSTRKYGQAVRAVHRSVRVGEERGQRTFHRGEPGEVEGHDGAPAGQDAALRVADRCDAVRRSADGGRVGHRCRTGGKRSWASGKEPRRTRRWWASYSATWWSRGLDFTEPRLYVLDGGKALTAAVKKHAGESAAIQRCQVHKRRNVLDHLTDEQKPEVAQEAERGLRSGRLCRRQASAEHAASRIDGSQSERGAEFGRRDGGDADRASASRPDATAEDPGQHQRDRVGVLHCGAGL